ncbi:ermin [Ctenodactylus gundi]
MTDVPTTFREVECNGDSPPENDPQLTTKISEDATDMDGTTSRYRVEPSHEGLLTKGSQEESGRAPGKTLLNRPRNEEILQENPEEDLFIVHKAITDLSLQETSADEMIFREGRQWEKIPLNSPSTQEISRPKDLDERDENRKSKSYQETEVEWLGFRKCSQADVLHSKHEEEPEVWDDETNHDEDVDGSNDDEDEVRVIEFKKKHEEGSQLKEEGNVSEDSPLSSPSSQAVTPEEQPMLGKKGDFSRSVYSRYNTISYRKIRKGNTKQRIDEFESMMHL